MEKYLKELEGTKSIAFFYSNYSNPITGDDYSSKYLLLGARISITHISFHVSILEPISKRLSLLVLALGSEFYSDNVAA